MSVLQDSHHAYPYTRHETLAAPREAAAEIDGAALAIRELDVDGRTVRVVPVAHELGHALTPRERDVVALMSDGLTNREIAERLGISRATVKVHVRHILDKLGRLREPLEDGASTRR
jgi:DNA-binding CsgD family transcriptional regulator